MRKDWNIAIDRASCMMLDPLTDIGVGVFVTVRVSRGQRVVDILGHGERRQPQHDADHAHPHPKTEQRDEPIGSGH